VQSNLMQDISDRLSLFFWHTVKFVDFTDHLKVFPDWTNGKWVCSVSI